MIAVCGGSSGFTAPTPFHGHRPPVTLTEHEIASEIVIAEHIFLRQPAAAAVALGCRPRHVCTLQFWRPLDVLLVPWEPVSLERCRCDTTRAATDRYHPPADARTSSYSIRVTG